MMCAGRSDVILPINMNPTAATFSGVGLLRQVAVFGVRLTALKMCSP